MQRKIIFACLYFSEGAPIGFLWLALPTRLRVSGVPIDEITWLTAVLVLPWTFKFGWAPLVDLLQSPRWTLRSWIVAAQSVMGLTLLSLLFLDPVSDFYLLAVFLVVHATAAATQDVAIDALCISVTDPLERGEINGWMQTGMLLGRAMLGGGALVMAPIIGNQAVVGLLVGVTTFSMLLVLFLPLELRPGTADKSPVAPRKRFSGVASSLGQALKERNTWIGLAFALTGGAAFKALEVIYGPFLIDRGFTEAEVGSFAALPMIGLMVSGSLAGGFLSDRLGRRRLVAGSLVLICLAVATLSVGDLTYELQRSSLLLFCLAVAAFGIGLFTSASYALFMDITNPSVAATQFSAFMGLTNGCESWSTWTAGRIIATSGYPLALLPLCGVSLLSLSLLPLLRPSTERDDTTERDGAADARIPSTGRSRHTVRVATTFAVAGIFVGTLLSILRSSSGSYYFRAIDEWPVWLIVAQLVVMPLVLRVCGWPLEWWPRLRFITVNVVLTAFAVLGFLHLVEITLYRTLELILRLLVLLAWGFAVSGIVPVVYGIWKRRRLKSHSPFFLGRLWFACLIGLALSESLCGWLLRREMTLTFPRNLPASPDGELHVAAIGGSTMLGFPYNPKYGIAEVAVWRLRQLYPERTVRLHNLAVGGQNLREAVDCLHSLKCRPDLLLVYSGHNEFYRDLWDIERTAESPFRDLDPLLTRSPTFVMTYRLLSKRAALKELKQALMQDVNRPGATLIRDHIAPVAIYEDRLVRFRRQLEQLGDFCRHEDIAAIWYVPAANECDWEPNRSSLTTFRTAKVVQELRQTYAQARRYEADGKPDAAIRVYRQGLRTQPDFAEFHYRLGQCLLSLNQDAEAAHHFQRALDTDAHPIRANADYREIVADVARQFQIPLIDSPAVLRPHTERGLLDRTMFHDNVHPTLKAFFLLGTAACDLVVETPHLRSHLGQPVSVSAADFARSVADARVTAADLSLTCSRIAYGTRWMTRWRFDATARIEAYKRLERWSRQLKAGEIQPGEDGSEPLPQAPSVRRNAIDP